MNKNNHSIWPFFIIQELSLLVLLLFFYTHTKLFAKTKWSYLSGVITKQEHNIITIKQDNPQKMVYGDIRLDEYVNLYYDNDFNIMCNVGDSISAYYVVIKEVKFSYRVLQESQTLYNYVVELKVNNKPVLYFDWWYYHKNYFYVFIIILLTVIIQYPIMYHLSLKVYKRGALYIDYFILKFKKLNIPRGSWRVIPNTNITANLIRSEENKYMIFDYDNGLILSTTRWKSADRRYYNFKFKYNELTIKKIEDIRKHIDWKKYKANLIELNTAKTSLDA